MKRPKNIYRNKLHRISTYLTQDKKDIKAKEKQDLRDLLKKCI